MSDRDTNDLFLVEQITPKGMGIEGPKPVLKI